MTPSAKPLASSPIKWKRKAVMDFGTNTFHLLIADVSSQGHLKKVLHRKITVKLGKGGIHKGHIAPAAFIKAVASFRKDLDRFGIKHAHAFGTAALRTASNGAEFKRIVQRVYGVSLKVIQGDQEAELICAGVRHAIDVGNRTVLIMDIGGGSTEFIITNAKRIFWKHSFKLGSSFLLETFQPSDPISRGDLRNMESYFSGLLDTLFFKCSKHKPEILIGSAGSFETFASMIRHMHPESGRHYSKRSHPIDIVNFQELHRRLLASTHEERIHMRGLLKMRADMIVPASILLNFVLRKTKIRKMELSSYSLKEGALLS
jgi:exopolyphosphatase / guanosine-5'-triphosphate,3'-diphosphate pyrophosphatase